jgi:hypothetical protein
VLLGDLKKVAQLQPDGRDLRIVPRLARPRQFAARLGGLVAAPPRTRPLPPSVAEADPAFTVALIEDGWGERYGRRVELARLLGRKSGKTSMDKLAAQIGADGAKVLAAIDADRERAWLGLLPALRLLREVWGQQYREHAGAFRLASPTSLRLPPSVSIHHTTPRCATTPKAAGMPRTSNGSARESI